MNKRNILFFLFILSFLLFFSSVASATDNFNQSTDSQLSSSLDDSTDDMNIKNTDNNMESSKSIVLNSENFDEYVTQGKFNEKVSDGDTVDIQGKLDGTKFALEVDKPVNIISSNGEGYIDLNTSSRGTDGSYINGIFKVSEKASGLNISGITFHNTRVSIEGVHDVYINNISCICESNIGMGVGSFSIREKSENVTVSNSFFKTYYNGGHSNVVVAGASNCLIENNTIEGDGSNGIIGNLLYLTTYNAVSSNTNITIRNNTLRSYNTYGYGTCYGLAIEGKGHLIENNIIDTSIPLKNQYAEADYNFETNVETIIFKNNTVYCSEYNSVNGQHTPAELKFPGIVSDRYLQQ